MIWSKDLYKTINQKHISEITKSDFFVSDLKHRIVGLKWIRGKDICPAVSFVSSPLITEFVLAKQIIFMTGKKIYYDNEFSARLTHYAVGELLDGEFDLEAAATLYAIFL